MDCSRRCNNMPQSAVSTTAKLNRSEYFVADAKDRPNIIEVLRIAGICADQGEGICGNGA